MDVNRKVEDARDVLGKKKKKKKKKKKLLIVVRT
jgi:hypothetical protein